MNFDTFDLANKTNKASLLTPFLSDCLQITDSIHKSLHCKPHRPVLVRKRFSSHVSPGAKRPYTAIGANILVYWLIMCMLAVINQRKAAFSPKVKSLV